MSQGRLARLIKEKDRALHWPQVYIDSDIWQEGVQQRTQTKELLKYIDVDLHKEKDSIQAMEAELEKYRVDVAKCSTRLKVVVTEIERLMVIIDDIEVLLASIERGARGGGEGGEQTNKAVTQSLLDKIDIKDEEDVNIIKREKAHALQELIKRQGYTSKAHRLRAITVTQRTYEEAQWVALDMLQHPDMYANLSVLEREHMDQEESYKTILSAEDMDRIASLPEELNEAMPFLKTMSELHAHYLYTKYSLEREEEHIIEYDKNITLVDDEFKLWISRRQKVLNIRNSSTKTVEQEEWADYDYILQREAWQGLPREKMKGVRRSEIEEILTTNEKNLSDPKLLRVKKLLDKYSPLEDRELRDRNVMEHTQVVNSMSLVSKRLLSGPVLIDRKESMSLLNIQDNFLSIRESRTHGFIVPHEIIGIKVTCIKYVYICIM